MNLAVGKTYKLRPLFLDQMGRRMSTVGSVSFVSDTPSVATVDSTGLIVGVSNGTANITATNGNMTSGTAITVYTPILTSISI